MDKSKLPIGIFDSGVGGLTVVNKLRMLLPHENIIYVGDTKRNPYGSRTAAEILSYTRDILRFMSAQSVKLVAIGCNTVTATVYPQLMQEVPYPLIGMSKGIKTAQKISAGGTIAVFATELTIANHSHKKAAAAWDPGLKIIEQPCPELAGLIERGYLQGTKIMAPLQKYLAPVLQTQADTAIFGCTHFPFIQPLFEMLSQDRLAFVDPAHEMALEVLEVLKKADLLNRNSHSGTLQLCFTDATERGGMLAAQLIPKHEFSVQKIRLI